MPRLIPLCLALLALTACLDDYPSSPSFTPAATQRSVAVQMLTGDSLDLTALAAERFGLLDVQGCTSADPGVAELVESERIVALTAGESLISCVGALDTRIDTTIDEGGLPTDNRTWVSFDVRLQVSPAEELTEVPEEPVEPQHP